MQKKREKMKRRSDSEAWRVLNLINKTGIERGQNAEDRVSRIFCGDKRAIWPAWLYGMRKGDSQEDSLGIDFVAETNLGPVPIQIKSSGRGVANFKSHWRYKPTTVVVVIKTGDGENEVAHKVIGAVAFARKSLPNYHR
mgnify:CR=1 FL=1